MYEDQRDRESVFFFCLCCHCGALSQKKLVASKPPKHHVAFSVLNVCFSPEPVQTQSSNKKGHHVKRIVTGFFLPMLFVVHRVLDRSTGTSDNLGDLILFFMESKLNEELCKHRIDLVECEIRFS